MRHNNRKNSIPKWLKSNCKAMVLIAVAIFCIIAPVIVEIKWDCFSPEALLGYYGSIIGSAIALAVAIIAYKQSKQINESETALALHQRRKEICPSLQVSVARISDGVYRLEITNHSPYNAVGVYLYEYSLHPCIRGNDTMVKLITTDKQKTEYLYVHPTYVELNNANLPKEIALIYSDRDNNHISDVFVCYGNEYELEVKEYLY